jgi:hypothetical protein
MSVGAGTGATQDPSPIAALTQEAYICGCGHSGSTILATILGAHPSIYVPLYESEAFLVDEAERTRRLDVIRRQARAAGKPVLIEKTPRHVRKLDVIRRVVPGVRFLLVVRDGRDVAASIGHRYSGNLEEGFQRWVSDNGIIAREYRKPDTLVMRYEDLVTNPREVLAAVCAFVGVEYRADLLEYHKRPSFWFDRPTIRRTNGVGAGDHEDLRNWQVNQPLFDGRGRWKKELPADVVQRFQQGDAGRLMRGFGYL